MKTKATKTELLKRISEAQRQCVIAARLANQTATFNRHNSQYGDFACQLAAEARRDGYLKAARMLSYIAK